MVKTMQMSPNPKNFQVWNTRFQAFQLVQRWGCSESHAQPFRWLLCRAMSTERSVPCCPLRNCRKSSTQHTASSGFKKLHLGSGYSGDTKWILNHFPTMCKCPQPTYKWQPGGSFWQWPVFQGCKAALPDSWARPPEIRGLGHMSGVEIYPDFPESQLQSRLPSPHGPSGGHSRIIPCERAMPTTSVWWSTSQQELLLSKQFS